jgi:predicted enzyme related to lactoylglutathione lyase
MFTGLQTVVYGVADIGKAKDWYMQVLGKPPYFDQPSFYVGFNVGGYELGLDPNASSLSEGSAGVVAYWGVDDIHSEYRRLLSLGAKEHVAVRDVGEGILVGTVLDPFGNLFGLIHNPHFQRK